MTGLTYGELRTNAEKIADRVARERVLRGIEVLNEKYGPDWVDHVDPAVLCLSSTVSCVLGQLYADADAPASLQIKGQPPRRLDGYWKGLAIIDGEVEGDPAHFGFATADEDDDINYGTLTSAWRMALGYREGSDGD